MKKRWLIALLGLLMAAVTAIFLRKPPPSPMASYQGKSAHEWLGEVFSTNQTAAFQAFRSMGSNALPAIVDGFRQRDNPWTRFCGAIYPKLPAALQRHLAAPKPAVEFWSAAQLVLLNENGTRPILPELMKQLSETDNPAREYILLGAGSLFDQRAGDCVPTLIPLLQDTNFNVRTIATYCLQSIGPEARAAIPALTANLKDPDIGLRVASAWALWNIARETNIATAALRETLDSGFKMSAVYLYQIDPTDATLIPVFVKLLNGKDESLRLSSAAIVGGYGPAASTAVPGLVKAIESGNPNLRGRALDSLAKIDLETALKYEASAPAEAGRHPVF